MAVVLKYCELIAISSTVVAHNHQPIHVRTNNVHVFGFRDRLGSQTFNMFTESATNYD